MTGAGVALALVAATLVGFRVLVGPGLNRWPMTNAPTTGAGIICFGDSLVAGIGAGNADDRYPSVLGRLLDRPVLALGVAGETTGAGLTRLRNDPRIRAPVMVITLGGNDIIKRVPWPETERNLRALIRECQARGCLVVFTGVEGLTGGRHARGYRNICRDGGAVLVPDVLDGILSNPDLKSDQIHPNAAGYRIMAERVAAALRPFLASEPARDVKA
jgi:lysophospholipase L1-like esterase